tara:strand:+ start:1113 stop:1910 length:798 start_codon:yes stop_codon:yes gene_type:complete
MTDHSPEENTAYTLKKNESSNILFLCDHATNNIPSRYKSLGLTNDNLNDHIAYDVGARSLVKKLSRILKANYILSNFSRLLIDPNRSVDDPTLIMKFADQYIIPGNKELSKNERDQRIKLYYNPYHEKIEEICNSIVDKNLIPILISIHSFTKNFRNDNRSWQISILWDKDDRIANLLLRFLMNDRKYNIGDNEPYVGYLPGDTLNKHATLNGFPHVLIEVRNDLINTEESQIKMADYLSKKIDEAIKDNWSNINKIKKFGSRSK